MPPLGFYAPQKVKPLGQIRQTMPRRPTQGSTPQYARYGQQQAAPMGSPLQQITRPPGPSLAARTFSGAKLPGGAATAGAQPDGQPPGGGIGQFDTDPVLQEMYAMAARSRAMAQAGYLSKKKQAGIEYGDVSGLGLDETTAKAASDNPFSILANLNRQQTSDTTQLEDALNKENLFYSGARGTKLGELSTDYQGQRQDAGNRFRSFITDLDNALAEALMNADFMEAQALMQARDNAVNSALDSGSGYAGGETSAGGFTPPSAAAAPKIGQGIGAGIAAGLGAGRPAAASQYAKGARGTYPPAGLTPSQRSAWYANEVVQANKAKKKPTGAASGASIGLGAGLR